LEEIDEELNATVEAAAEVVIKLMNKLCSDENFPKLVAKFVKRYYDALIAEGFTKQQALEIVTRMQFPAISSKS